MGHLFYFFLGGSFTVALYLAKRRNRLPLPPGPKPLPIIGNLLDLPQEQGWTTFTEWKERYGDLIFLDVLGSKLLILNSLEATNELLDKRSRLYSSRPGFTMIVDLMGWDFGMGFMQYSERWRLARRYFHQYFNANAVQDFKGIHERRAVAFCRNLLDTPEKFRDHIRSLFAENILEAVYGIEVQGLHDPFVVAAETAMAAFSIAATPGRFLVDTLPILKHIPAWVPGAGFQKFATDAKPAVLALRDLPADYVRKQIENGTAKPSMMSRLYTEQLPESEVPEPGLLHNEGKLEDAAKNSAAAAYSAGADTANSAAQGFFLLMANYPHCQKAAQAELDSVIGEGRLPTYQDRQYLPYVNALVKEVLRYHVVAPLGLPHLLIEDDEFNGYHIPKGTQVFGNIWAILRDSKIYPDPHLFNPERWLIDTPEGKKLNKAIPDPDSTFGFGRRICPGRYFADNSLFMTIANVLTCFDISPPDPGKKLNERCTEGILVFPLDFQVSIKPRSEKMARLVNDTIINDMSEKERVTTSS